MAYGYRATIIHKGHFVLRVYEPLLSLERRILSSQVRPNSGDAAQGPESPLGRGDFEFAESWFRAWGKNRALRV